LHFGNPGTIGGKYGRRVAGQKYVTNATLLFIADDIRFALASWKKLPRQLREKLFFFFAATARQCSQEILKHDRFRSEIGFSGVILSYPKTH
jgi:hypothetical protein